MENHDSQKAPLNSSDFQQNSSTDLHSSDSHVAESGSSHTLTPPQQPEDQTTSLKEILLPKKTAEKTTPITSNIYLDSKIFPKVTSKKKKTHLFSTISSQAKSKSSESKSSESSTSSQSSKSPQSSKITLQSLEEAAEKIRNRVDNKEKDLQDRISHTHDSIPYTFSSPPSQGKTQGKTADLETSSTGIQPLQNSHTSQDSFHKDSLSTSVPPVAASHSAEHTENSDSSDISSPSISSTSAVGEPTSVPVIVDTPPQNVRDDFDLVRFFISFFSVFIIIGVSIWFQETTSGVEHEVHRISQPLHWLVQLPLSFILSLTMIIVVCFVIIQLLVRRLWITTITACLGFFGGFSIALLFSLISITFWNSLIGIQITQAHNWLGTGPFELFLALIAFLTAANGLGFRKNIRWAWNTLFVVIFIVLAVNAITLTSLLLSCALGYAFGVLLRFGIGTPSTSIWGKSLIAPLQEVGFNVTTLGLLTYSSSVASLGKINAHKDVNPEKIKELFPSIPPDILLSSTNLAFSDDFTHYGRLYCATTDTNENVLVAVSNEQSHIPNYFSQIWDSIKVKGLTIRKDRTVRATAEHHIAMLLSLARLHLPVATPLAMSEANGSVLLVFPLPQEPISCLDFTTLTDEQAITIFEMLHTAHSRGITHRNICAESFGYTKDKDIVIAGWINGDIGSSRAHIQLDHAQLLVLLSATIGIERALALAQKVLDPRALSTLTPYIQSIIIPPSTKHLKGWNRHLLKTLRTRLKNLYPEEDITQMEDIHLARFSIRRLIGIALVLVALVAVFTQLNFEKMVEAITHANPWWAVASFVISIVSWGGSAIAFGIFIPKSHRKRHHLGILGTQAAASFAAVSLPSSTGPIVINIQFLRKIGYDTAKATAIASADMVAEYTTTLLMFIVLGIFTGQNALQKTLPDKNIFIAMGVIGAVIAAAFLIPQVRTWFTVTALPKIKIFGKQLLQLFSKPSVLLISALGSVLQNVTLAMSFWFALYAFGYDMNFITMLFFFLFANTIGSAAPTPGGLGAVETLMSLTFINLGVPPTVAVSATLLYRLFSYWGRMILGGIYMKWMERKNLL